MLHGSGNCLRVPGQKGLDEGILLNGRQDTSVVRLAFNQSVQYLSKPTCVPVREAFQGTQRYVMAVFARQQARCPYQSRWVFFFPRIKFNRSYTDRSVPESPIVLQLPFGPVPSAWEPVKCRLSAALSNTTPHN